MNTIWRQYTVALEPRPRGCHLITDEVVSAVGELSLVSIGLLHVFLQHTSAGLTLNENADPDVRTDLETHLSRLVPDGAPHFTHRCEGPDDMPAHVKSSLLGASLVVPVAAGRLALGVWQGVYLCEHRARGGPRRAIATLFGMADG